MGGKAALVLVIGFMVILGVVARDLTVVATRAQGNMSTYSAATESHNLAITGANAGLARLYQDTSWRGTQTQTLSTFGNGSFTYTVANGANGRPALRSVSLVRGPFETLRDTVEVQFASQSVQSFTLFFWTTNFEGNVFWISNDTVWGRVHTNGSLHINGSPVFMRKVTTSKGLDPAKVGTGTNKAVFKDSYETGVAPITFPTDLSQIQTASVSGGRKYAGDIYVTLSAGTGANNDGKAYIRSGNTSSGALIDSIDLSDASFNGVILGTGKVNVEGTLDGKLTISSQTNVYIQNDILYERNPQAGLSDDLLGLVAEKNVIVKDNAANRNNCEIHGSIFCRDGSFSAENYTSLPVCGELKILGSIVQNERGAIGTFSGGSLKTGFSKRYRYDDRLADENIRPPCYPGFFTTTYAISCWWESVHIPQFN
jgi:hypothetical protein